MLVLGRALVSVRAAISTESTEKWWVIRCFFRAQPHKLTVLKVSLVLSLSIGKMKEGWVGYMCKELLTAVYGSDSVVDLGSGEVRFEGPLQKLDGDPVEVL